jgi:hypothetical protein
LKNTTKIGILGCGWLGKATAKALLNKGYEVRGSSTTNDGAQVLKNIGIKAFVIHLKPETPIKNLDDFLHGLQILVIAIPPKFKKGETELLDAFKFMFESYDFSDLKKLIYISSTGVFKDGQDVEYDEDSTPNNNSDRGQYLIGLEEFILNQDIVEDKYVIRYGGLIKHGGRHPVHYLSGRKDIKDPLAPVNLIEQADAVNLLCKLIETAPERTTFHGVYPDHPSRIEYYTCKAKGLNLSQPNFKTQNISLGKTILSKKTQIDLDFKFKSGI